ncbi:hypothetical protein SORBI_3005G083866 [Sorghum bicolor]|uniref:Uncharacterized protein n=1 Tax=Sorghum bicolor TaxID=4558 RepID=A0A1Z5RHB0_SORBI|nr:hypothetical protein SORBI_3005G083866 [Sorghum bicolor]
MAHQLAPPVTAAQPYTPHPAFSACYAGHTLPSHGLPRRRRLSLALARRRKGAIPWPISHRLDLQCSSSSMATPPDHGSGWTWQLARAHGDAGEAAGTATTPGMARASEGLGLDGGGGALGLGLRAGALALGEDAGRRERLHEAAHHGIARALRRRPDAERREQRLRGLGSRGSRRWGGVGGSLGGSGQIPRRRTLGRIPRRRHWARPRPWLRGKSSGERKWELWRGVW